MGRKVNPKIFRIGVSTRWTSKWFSSKDYAVLFEQDLKIRKYLKTKLKAAAVSSIEVERLRDNINVIIFSAKPGFIIGKNGVGVEDLKADLYKKFIEKFISKTGKKYTLNLEIKEVEDPSLDAEIVLQSMVVDIEKRVAFRRVMKQAISKIERAGGKGVKVIMSGRLNGSEIARSEMLKSGKLPLNTIRSQVDYSRGVARTIFGAIGIKVWIYKGEKF